MENTKEAIEEYEREYRRDMEDIRRQEKEKGLSEEGSYQGDLWQKDYLDGQTKGMTKNIGQG